MRKLRIKAELKSHLIGISLRHFVEEGFKLPFARAQNNKLQVGTQKLFKNSLYKVKPLMLYKACYHSYNRNIGKLWKTHFLLQAFLIIRLIL